MRHAALGVERIVEAALEEDLSTGDPTTELLIPADAGAEAAIVSRAEGVLAGLDACLAVFRRLDASLVLAPYLHDGDALSQGSVIARVEGAAAAILGAERTALNLLQRLSGIATLTRRYVSAVQGYDVRIVDTRKTTPGLRALEKAAVRAGGGFNHRRNLGDGILIKDNHLEVLRVLGTSLKQAVEAATATASHTLRVEVEVETLDQVREALAGGAGIILLDNMAPIQMAAAVEVTRGKAVTEASGGITLANVREVAATGVDLISVGALTHSAPALDIGLDLVRAFVLTSAR